MLTRWNKTASRGGTPQYFELPHTTRGKKEHGNHAVGFILFSLSRNILVEGVREREARGKKTTKSSRLKL
jgi:hypothetical protein